MMSEAWARVLLAGEAWAEEEDVIDLAQVLEEAAADWLAYHRALDAEAEAAARR